MAKTRINGFVAAASHATPTTGEVIRMLRELKGWTQVQLAEKCGISDTNLSLLENDRVDIGKKRLNSWQKHLKCIRLSLCFLNMRQRLSGKLHKCTQEISFDVTLRPARHVFLLKTVFSVDTLPHNHIFNPYEKLPD